MASHATHAGSSAAPAAVRCPRCGYDLRGELSRWTERCPLEGVCTECGLDVRWMDLLSPVIRHPAWCVERPGSALGVPRRWLSTTLMALLHPWRFWTELRLSHPVQRRGLLLFVVGWLVAAYLILTLAVAVTFAMVDRRAPASLLDVNLVSLGIVLAAPWWPEPLETTRTAAAAAGAAGGLPLGRAGWSAAAPLWFFERKATPVLIILVGAAVMMAASAATFLALPVTRRRCKVRMAHAWRVAVYGLPICLPLLTAHAMGDVLFAFGVGGPAWHAVYRALLLGTLLLVPIWWAAATARYMRMPHAWAVAAASVTVGTLATAVVLLNFALPGVLSL